MITLTERVKERYGKVYPLRSICKKSSLGSNAHPSRNFIFLIYDPLSLASVQRVRFGFEHGDLIFAHGRHSFIFLLLVVRVLQLFPSIHYGARQDHLDLDQVQLVHILIFISVAIHKTPFYVPVNQTFNFKKANSHRTQLSDLVYAIGVMI